MAPTEEQFKALIIQQVKDNDNRDLAKNIDGLWLVHEQYSAIPGYRYLQVLKSAIFLMLGQERELVDRKEEDKEIKVNQRSKNLQEMYDRVEAEIISMQASLNARRRRNNTAVGLINRTVLIPNPYAVSAEQAAIIERRLRGDAYLGYREWLYE